MRIVSLALAALMAFGVSACGGGDEADGPLGAAQQAQLDPGLKDYVIYGLTNATGASLGNVLVTATAGDGYSANVEYWYLTSNPSNSSALTITGGASEAWSTPPSGLGTLSFTTERTPTWTSANMRGSMLEYTNALTGELDAINWQMSDATGAWTGTITWWHNTTGNMFGPGVTRTLSPASPRGSAYYYTTSPL